MSLHLNAVRNPHYQGVLSVGLKNGSKIVLSLLVFKDPCHVSLCPLFIFKFFKEVIHTVRGSYRPSINKKATLPSNFVNGCLAGQAHFFILFFACGFDDLEPERLSF